MISLCCPHAVLLGRTLFIGIAQLIYDPLAIFQPASAAATRSRIGETDDRRPQSASPAHVWARQREDDTIFLAPEALVGSGHVVAEASDAVGVTEGALVTMASGESDEEYGDVSYTEGSMSGKRPDGAEWESTNHEEVKISRCCKNLALLGGKHIKSTVKCV